MVPNITELISKEHCKTIPLSAGKTQQSKVRILIRRGQGKWGQHCCMKKKMSENKTRDLCTVRCVKNEDQKVLVRNEKIKERWRVF